MNTVGKEYRNPSTQKCSKKWQKPAKQFYSSPSKTHQVEYQNTKKQEWQPCDHWFGLKLPGTEVPKATKAIALTVSFKKMKHPKWEATSPITAVIRPIVKMDTVKVMYPPCKPNEGTTVIYAYAY